VNGLSELLELYWNAWYLFAGDLDSLEMYVLMAVVDGAQLVGGCRWGGGRRERFGSKIFFGRNGLASVL